MLESEIVYNDNIMDDLFIRFGLSQKESTAFLELVRLGACPVSTWAKHANINRTSMYVMMERFKSLGLVNTFVHKGIMYVQAIRMAEISALLYDKERCHIANLSEEQIKYLPEAIDYYIKQGGWKVGRELIQETAGGAAS